MQNQCTTDDENEKTDEFGKTFGNEKIDEIRKAIGNEKTVGPKKKT